jgi:hypothetical protein
MKNKLIRKASVADMVYEGIGKQDAAQKELRAKRTIGKSILKAGAHLGGKYKGRYSS